jgi:hypothetical protein
MRHATSAGASQINAGALEACASSAARPDLVGAMLIDFGDFLRGIDAALPSSRTSLHGAWARKGWGCLNATVRAALTGAITLLGRLSRRSALL